MGSRVQISTVIRYRESQRKRSCKSLILLTRGFATSATKRGGFLYTIAPHVFGMRLCLIDEPSPFDTLATWQCHLEECCRLPADTMLKSELIRTAEEAIARLVRDPPMSSRPLRRP
jgi:hypothetical protein